MNTWALIVFFMHGKPLEVPNGVKSFTSEQECWAYNLPRPAHSYLTLCLSADEIRRGCPMPETGILRCKWGITWP